MRVQEVLERLPNFNFILEILIPLKYLSKQLVKYIVLGYIICPLDINRWSEEFSNDELLTILTFLPKIERNQMYPTFYSWERRSF